MKLRLDINIDEITQSFKDFKTEISQDLTQAVGNLAQMTFAKTQEMASAELHTSRKPYLDSLSIEEIAPGLWVVAVDESGLWVEEGIKADTDMKPGLLKENAKVSKDGHRYKVIPFDHAKAPSQMTPAAQNIVNALKLKLKEEGIPFKKIEKNSDGSPRTGLIHSLDLGGAKPGRGVTPALNGVNIYQTVTKTGNVRRDITTFRTVSDSPNQEGRWIHPGLAAKKYLDKAMDWALEKWENEILPEVMKKWE